VGDTAGVIDDRTQPEYSEYEEPQDHHRPEHSRDPLGAPLLDEEQHDEDGDRHGDHPRLEGVRGDLETLDRAQHRDRRRDQAITVEQRRPEHSEGDDHPLRSRREPQPRHQQRGQGEDAALTVIVGAHHEHQVLDRDDDDEGPEHNRRHAVGIGAADLELGVLERFPERVQRARADVAVDDPQSAEREGEQAAVRAVIGVLDGRHGPPSYPHSCRVAGTDHQRGATSRVSRATATVDVSRGALRRPSPIPPRGWP
jgi:hypothetical protein